jgi:hypothetical protein
VERVADALDAREAEAKAGVRAGVMKFRRRIFTQERWWNSDKFLAYVINFALFALLGVLLGLGF